MIILIVARNVNFNKVSIKVLSRNIKKYFGIKEHK
jgi:hypothetical protein